MSTPTDKIRAGLDQRQKAGGTVPISNLFGAPSNLAQLKDAVQKLATARDKLAKLASDTVAAVESSREEIEYRYSELGKVRDGRVVVDQLGDVRRRAMVDREATKAARAIRKQNSEERAKLAAAVRDLKAKLDSVCDSWGHPVTVLDRRTRLDSNRAILTQNFQDAGVAAITNALRDAIVSGDAALAISALNAAEKLSKESRKLIPFAARDVAEAIPEVRSEYQSASRLIASAEIAAAEAELAQAQADGSRGVAELSMKVGRLKTELKALLGEPEPDDESGEGEPTADSDVRPAIQATEPKSYGLTDEEWQQMLDAARADE